MSSSNFYVYLHRKKSTGQIFYIGKGTGNRAWETSRGQHWKNIVAKHGYYVEFVIKDVQEWYAFELECELICFYGRLDLKSGTLINKTNGGDGVSGHLISDELRLKYKDATTAKWKQPVFKDKLMSNLKAFWASGESNATRRSMSACRTGKPRSEATKLKISQKQLGKFISDETKEKLRLIHLGRKWDPEVVAKRSDGIKKSWAARKAKMHSTSV